MSDFDDIVSDFLVESHEGLDQLDQNLVALEQDTGNTDLLAAIFRCIHTIKGTCGFLGFGKLERVSHVGENLLSKLRDGELVLNQQITDALLAMVDAIREMLGNIESSGSDGENDYGELVDRLTALLNPNAGAPPEETTAAAGPQKAAQQARRRKKRSTRSARKPKDEGAAPAQPTEISSTGRPSPAAGMEVIHGASESIRVDVGLLDELMTLVGELVLARNQVLQCATDQTLTAAAQRLNLITTELQESVMKTRMQPIGNIWNKFPRVIRDLAKSCGKKVRLEMEGADTELDKTLIEAIKDPLTHIVRNSVDHGIETPSERKAAGKDEEGLVFIRAYHEGGQVNIEISDDGGGIDTAQLRDKAVEKGLLSAEHAARLSERDVMNLIFHAGFSTAKRVTNVSGRGVGMDVVKTNIERISGVIDIQSARGEGTTIKIKIPLTLAIIPALIVHSGDERFAIPQVSLLELVRLDRSSGNGIEEIHGAPVYRLRGRLLPLVFLSKELGQTIDGSNGNRDEPAVANIVVLQADDRQFGLVVDGISDSGEIVVKPLSNLLKGLEVFAGATIMGDGKVGLILDVLGLAQRARVISEVKDRSIRDHRHADSDTNEERQSLLLFRTPDDGRMAIDLARVARLERFRRGDLEWTGNRQVVQYRGDILKLIDIRHALPERRSEIRTESAERNLSDDVQVVVISGNNGPVGLVIDEIVDIVSEAVNVNTPGSRPGVIGTAVVQERVTEFLDVEQLTGGNSIAFNDSDDVLGELAHV